jgi:hypothetical protein
MTMLVPGLTGLLGITPIGIVDGLVIGGSAILPLLVNEATKKPSLESKDMVTGRTQATLSSEADPAANGGLPVPFAINIVKSEGGEQRSHL